MTNNDHPTIEPVVFSHPAAQQPAEREATEGAGTDKPRQMSFSERATAQLG
ncbi:hypothetical protein [Actinokineospora sp. HUAS TT18]|uniref:hypothetical protein n=1 Tax=Actinokineospora sp. HUAS TT18 TaxID=3447451 RepID=UPI003F521E36